MAAWLDADPDTPRRELMAGLNAACGTDYPVRRLSDWLHGHAAVPRAVQDLLRSDLLEYLFGPEVGALIRC